MNNYLKIATVTIVFVSLLNINVTNAHEIKHNECFCHQHEKQETNFSDITDLRQYNNYSFYRDEQGRFCAHPKNGWISFNCRETPFTIEPDIKKYEPLDSKGRE